MKTKLMILCEDTHGEVFFEKLAARLKAQNLIADGLRVNARKFYGICNHKLHNEIESLSNLYSYSFFVVVADADGHPVNGVQEKLLSHVPDDAAESTFTIIIDTEIEEWLCCSMGVAYGPKPSEDLHSKIGYEKYDLESYASSLDIRKLLKQNRSFKKFVESIAGIKVILP